MHPQLVHHLRDNLPELRRRWEALLRIERVNGPLANPDAMVHLIPDTLAQIFASLLKGLRRPISFMDAMADRLPGCECGNNPYLAYFVAGEQALVETVVLMQAKLPKDQQRESDVAEVIHVVRTLGRTEIDTFCGICAHRCKAAKCRHSAAARCAAHAAHA